MEHEPPITDPAHVEVSLIIPLLDESESLRELHRQIGEAFAGIARSYQMIFVDDGSTDSSWSIVQELQREDSRVIGVRLRRNFGKATALAAGVQVATGDVIVTMDADLQDDPAEIARMLSELESGSDLVSGWKQVRHDPLGKTLPSRLFNAITGRVVGLRLHDYNCGFKAARAQVYRDVPLYGELHRFVPALAHQLGYKVTEIPVNHRAREFGKSKYGFERFVRGFLDLVTVLTITRYGRRPGHLFGGIGLLFGFVGFAILSYLTGVWIFTDNRIGGRPLLQLGILLTVSSVQLFTMGMVAELIISRTPSRPPDSFVREYAGSPTRSESPANDRDQ